MPAPSVTSTRRRAWATGRRAGARSIHCSRVMARWDTRNKVGRRTPKFRRPRGCSGNMPVMLRLSVGVAIVAAAIGVAGQAHAQATPGPRRAAPAAPAGSNDPNDTWDKHTSIGLELGPGGVISHYDQNNVPSALLFYSSLRASYDVTPQWSGGLTFRQWWLPGSNHATMFGPIARWEPVSYEFGRAFVDLAIGATSTSFAWALGFDLGGGIEWNLPDAPGLSIGPYLRYNQVLNPDRRIVHVPFRPRGGWRATRRGAAPRQWLLPSVGARFRSRRRRRRRGPLQERSAGQASGSVQAGLPGERRGRRRGAGRRRRLPGDAARAEPGSEASRLPVHRHRQGWRRGRRRRLPAQARQAQLRPRAQWLPDGQDGRRAGRECEARAAA